MPIPMLPLHALHATAGRRYLAELKVAGVRRLDCVVSGTPQSCQALYCLYLASQQRGR